MLLGATWLARGGDSIEFGKRDDFHLSQEPGKRPELTCLGHRPVGIEISGEQGSRDERLQPGSHYTLEF